MNFKTIFKSFKNKDMRKRIFAVVGILIVYRFLAHIPVPLGDQATFKTAIENFIKGSDFGGFINLISGGGLTSFSILLVGLSPYITASIVMQLLTKAIPRMEELNKDGEAGRRKISQWTRMLTVPLAVLQSVAYIFILFQELIASNTGGSVEISFQSWALAVTAMTAGSVILMWLGELVTEQGIGNGISTVILCSIISSLPTTLAQFGAALFNTSAGSLSLFGWFTLPVNPTMFWTLIGLGLGILIVLYVLVKINEAQRIITINYAKRVHGNSAYGGIKSIMPIKLIAAGVVPVIFAVAFLSVPAFVGQLIQRADPSSQIAANMISWFSAPNANTFDSSVGLQGKDFIYPTLYFLLVVMFTYFYTSIVFNAQEIAENLQKQGGFIEGVRPGKQTEKYFSQVVNRLNLFGALALGLIAMLPYIVDYIFIVASGAPLGLSISGTGLLIVVTVALENMRQVNSRALMVTYDDYQ
ncbi:MAG: preprotein translocase subunit SecY [Candidatus Saccharibacteria bacterium]|nr:preprotein translocase subunit SecY [Candidatus Saccharibacteria bacterium]